MRVTTTIKGAEHVVKEAKWLFMEVCRERTRHTDRNPCRMEREREFLLTNHFYSQHGVDVSKVTAGSEAINKDHIILVLSS